MNIPEENIRYIDLPEVLETFSDSFGSLVFDGQSARIEFCVTRMDMPIHPQAPKIKKVTARKYPVCRLALTPEALFKLYDQLHQIITAMKEKGDIKTMEPIKGTTH